MRTARTRAAAVVVAVVGVVVAACGYPRHDPPPRTLHPATQLPSLLNPNNPLVPSPPGAPAPPAPFSAKGPRPADGEVRPARRSGPGVLDIENGDDSDAYVTLVRDGRPASTVYVWRSSDVEVDRVADGEYVVYYSTGGGWNGDVRRFTGNVRAAGFDNPLRFTPGRVGDGWTVYLQSTVGGTEPVTPVPDDSVPR